MRQHGIDPGDGGKEVQHGMSALKLSESKPASGAASRSRDVSTQPLTGQFVSKGEKSLYLEK